MKIFVNGRFRAHKITGLQRYAHEVSSRLLPRLQICQPRNPLRGWHGHIWEQTVLPLQSRSGLLWSPCATGPLSISRQIVTFHDLFPLESPQWYSHNFVLWYRTALTRLANASAHLIAVSGYTKKKLQDFFQIPEEKITVIYHGIEPAFHNVAPSAVLESASVLKLPSPRYLLFVGSLEPRKNLARLLAAWSRILPEIPSDIWLVVSGSGDPEVYKNAGFARLPARVYLTGYVPDASLCGLYAGSMGFLYPSLAEGFGFPPLEAMAAGVPVLTSSVSALPEVCGPDALYVNPTSIEDIARGIMRLITDNSLRSRLSAVGPAQARRFNWDQTAAQTLKVLEREVHRLSSPGQARFIFPAS